jgi:hypothetical protein
VAKVKLVLNHSVKGANGKRADFPLWGSKPAMQLISLQKRCLRNEKNSHVIANSRTPSIYPCPGRSLDSYRSRIVCRISRVIVEHEWLRRTRIRTSLLKLVSLVL